jgi:hypothetical protein
MSNIWGYSFFKFLATLYCDDATASHGLTHLREGVAVIFVPICR